MSVCCAVVSPTPAPSFLCVHGVFRSAEEATECARASIRDTAGDTFVVDQCNRWIRLRAPGGPGAAAEEEEVASPDNEDREHGRDGSVCDLKRPKKKAAPAQEGAEAGGGAQTQRRQLQALLDAPVDADRVTDAAGYDELRERYATLHAFERKLEGLVEESQAKCHQAWAFVEALDAKHPEYASTYRTRYTEALRQSGIPEERVGFMQYL